MHIALFGRPYNGQQYDYLQELIEILENQSISLVFHHAYYDFIKDKIKFTKPVDVFYGHKNLKEKAEMLLSVGGDGTLLDTITLVRDSGIPVLGINLGRLGFISSVSKDEMKQAVQSIVDGEYKIDARSMIRLETENNLFGDLNFALNELTIHKKESPALIVIHVNVNGNHLNSYWADGLIVSTPTGSTGYSLSCNGPILTPDTQNFIITPIATHNLTVRPIVIPDDCEIEITVGGRNQNFIVGLDSRYEPFDCEMKLKLKKESFTFNLVQLANKDFFTTIREKLKWGLDARN